MKYKCKHCGTIFGQKCNLGLHQRTAAYCLAIRGIDVEEISCNWCEKEYKNPQSLKNHLKTCAIKLLVDERIEEQLDELCQTKDMEIAELNLENMGLKKANRELKKTNVELEASLKEERHKFELVDQKATIYNKEYLAVRDKPTTRVTNTNNTVNNKLKMINTNTIEPFTLPMAKQRIEDDYTYEVFLNGKDGFRQFLLSIIIKDDEKNYASTGGKTRPSYHRLGESREWSEDKGTKFLSSVFDELIPSMEDYWGQLAEDLLEVELAGDEAEIARLEGIKEGVRPVAMGITATGPKKNEFLTEMLKQIKHDIAVD